MVCVHRERKITIFVDPDAEKKYLMLEELGCVLRELSALPGMYQTVGICVGMAPACL